MKKGLRGLACLLALAVLLLALPTGASAETWTADWTGSTMFTLTGTISNGSIILVAELYRNLGKIYINGVHGDSGPLDLPKGVAGLPRKPARRKNPVRHASQGLW